jgi:hypothetical protein
LAANYGFGSQAQQAPQRRRRDGLLDLRAGGVARGRPFGRLDAGSEDGLWKVDDIEAKQGAEAPIRIAKLLRDFDYSL